MVSQVSREIWESREIGVNLACTGPEERMGLRVQKAEPVLMESLVPSDLQEKRVNWEFQDYQVILEDKDPRAQVVSKGSLEPMERKEPGASQENLDPEDREDPRVLVELEVPGVQQENQVQREHQETTDLQARPEREGLKDLRDQWASQDQKAHLDLLEKMDCLDTLVSVERRVSKERLAPQVQEVWSGPRDRLERLVLLVREATPDPLVHPESRVFQEEPAKRELRETPDHKGPQVKTVPPA